MKNSTIDPNVVIERLYVPNVGAKPIPGGKGIIIVGLLAKDGFPAMLLIWDEGDENSGASATNCMAALLLWVYKNWPDFPVKTSIMIQRDSTGWFNRIEAEWRNSMSISRQAEHIVNFKPIRWPGTKPCTRQALLGMFGTRAKAAWDHVENLHATEARNVIGDSSTRQWSKK